MTKQHSKPENEKERNSAASAKAEQDAASRKPLPGVSEDQENTGITNDINHPDGLPTPPDQQERFAEEHGTPELTPTQEQRETMAKAAAQGENGTGDPSKNIESKSKKTVAPDGAEIKEVNGKLSRVITQDGQEVSSHPLSDAQVEAYNKHKTIKWENEGEAAAAEALTRYAFGEGNKEEFEKAISEMPTKERRGVFAIAKQLGLNDIINGETFSKED